MLGARMRVRRGTSAALLAIATGHWADENVSSPALCSWAWQRWGAGQRVLAGVEAGGDEVGQAESSFYSTTPFGSLPGGAAFPWCTF